MVLSVRSMVCGQVTSTKHTDETSHLRFTHMPKYRRDELVKLSVHRAQRKQRLVLLRVVGSVSALNSPFSLPRPVFNSVGRSFHPAILSEERREGGRESE